jgi:hypothetical protein
MVRLGIGSLVIAVAILAPVAAAEKPAAAPREVQPRREYSADEVAAARAFARAHHPELDALLARLETRSRAEFTTAVAELDRTRTRLEKLAANQPERHAVELEVWKLTSRIRLILARMAVQADAALESELRSLVLERQELRLRPLRAEQERLESRLAKVRAQVAAHDTDPAAALDAEVAELLAGVRTKQAAARKRAGRQMPGEPVTTVGGRAPGE